MNYAILCVPLSFIFKIVTCYFGSQKGGEKFGISGFKIIARKRTTSMSSMSVRIFVSISSQI